MQSRFPRYLNENCFKLQKEDLQLIIITDTILCPWISFMAISHNAGNYCTQGKGTKLFEISRNVDLFTSTLTMTSSLLRSFIFWDAPNFGLKAEKERYENSKI